MMRVLVIEDEPLIIDFVQRGLEAEGAEVTWASDAVEGERRALAGDVDLVILDGMLTGRNGLEVLRVVHQGNPALPVIMLSARAEVEDGSWPWRQARPIFWPSRSRLVSWWRGCALRCVVRTGGDQTTHIVVRAVRV